MPARTLLPVTPVLLLSLLNAFSSAVYADHFRVETDVFVEEDPQPVAENLTLFFGDVVYDFVLSEPQEITVFDVRRGRLVLLDPEREVRATLTTDELIEFTAAVEARSQRDRDAPLFSTSFETRMDEASGEMLLEGTNLVYRTKGASDADGEDLRRFLDFASWYARLNALRPGNPPPFARLELNRQLAERKMLPTEIARTLTLPGTFRDVQRMVRSRHAFTWSLSTTDRKRIKDAATHMANYRPVSLAEYWQVADFAQQGDSP